jgi:hypothetical protein
MTDPQFELAVPPPEAFEYLPDAADRIHKFDALGSALFFHQFFAEHNYLKRLEITLMIEQFFYDTATEDGKIPFEEEKYAEICFKFTELLKECPGLLKTIINRNSTYVLEKIPPKGFTMNGREFRLPPIVSFACLLETERAFRELPENKQRSIASRLEKACNNAACQDMQLRGLSTIWVEQHFQGTYVDYVVNLTDALRKNRDLLRGVITGDINIAELPRIKPELVRPDLYDEINKKIEESKKVSVRKKATTLYTCPKCKNNNCTYENVYNRSFDEGTSIKCTCVDCLTEFMV